MDIFDLSAKISLDASEYEQGLDNAETRTSTFGSKLKKGLGTAGKVVGTTVGAVATGVVVLGKTLVDESGRVANYGDNIDKMSQKLGLSTDAYQEWDYVLGQSGASIDSMQMGLKTLTNKMDDAKNGSESAIAAFETLGISMEDLSTMSREDLFEQAIYGFQSMADSTERAALANDLFGRSGQELTPLFNTTVEETMALQQAAHDLGFVLSGDAVKAAADYNDALDTMQRTMGGVKQSMVAEFLPSITTVMDGLTQVFAGGDGIEAINEGMDGLVTSISEAVPRVMEVGGQIVLGLLSAITSNLPMVMSEGTKIIMELVRGLISSLPMIISTGLQVIMDLVTGIGQALPELIPAAVSAILTIVDGLISNIGLLVEAAIQLIIGLAQGLISALPELITRIPEIVTALVEALIENAPLLVEAAITLVVMLAQSMIENIPLLVEAALQLIEGFISGILSMVGKVTEMGTSVVDWVKNGFDSAVSSAKEWGKNMINKIKDGVTSAWSGFISNITNKFNEIKAKVQAPFDAAKEIVKGAIDYIKGLFNFSWSLPKLKLPHFSLGTGISVLGITLPKIQVDWYKKAYEDPYLFSQPTVLGTAGGMKGFGDGAGGEMVYGHENLMRDIRDAVSAELGRIAIYLDGDKLVGGTSKRMDGRLGQMQSYQARWEGV